MAKNDRSISRELQNLSRRLIVWRSAHPPRMRLPEEFWREAVALAGREGIYRTAHALHVGYASLKKKVQAAPARSTPKSLISQSSRTHLSRISRGSKPTAFVELLAGSIGTDPNSDQPAECVIELEGAGGGRMRIQMKLTAPGVMDLIRDWRGERQA